MMEQGSEKIRKSMPVIAVLTLLISVSFGLMISTDGPNVNAASIGSISVTGGNTRSFNNVDYLLDGDILVSGSGSKLTFTNSTLTLSQDVGMDGELGGGDDHIYTISVESGGELVFDNTLLTTQTGQLSPYYKIDISVDGSGSTIRFLDSSVEGPGEITLTNRAHLVSYRSYFHELGDQSNMAYDIDGDGSSLDDLDFNDDGPLFSFLSGSSALIVDSELRDTLSFSTASRDGITAGNITVGGTGSNLTVINSFLDVDFESSQSTGTHNMLKVENGGIAHLVGVSINVSASSTASHPAFYVPDTSSKVVYYRWIGARVLDGMGIPVEYRDVTIYRVEGSTNSRLGSAYLTSEILDYMGRFSYNWNFTHEDGWAFIPVITDVFTSSSMPNADSYPDFLVAMTMNGETVQSSTSFRSYPNLPDMGDNEDLFQKARDGLTVSSKAISLVGGPLEFKRYITNPSTSSYFSGMDVDLLVSGRTSIRGTSSIIDGKFYPSFYAFDGHLIVGSGGHLSINDTTVAFLTDGSPAYILVQNGGTVELGNVTLMGMGDEALYVYAIGSGTPSITMDEGSMYVDHMVARNGALIDVECSNFSGSLNLIGSSVDATISAGSMSSDKVFAEDCTLQLDGSPVMINDIHLSGVTLYSYDSIFNIPLDIDNYAMLTNVSFSGSLPQGRTNWLKPVDSGVIARAWWVNAQVQDSVENPLPGSSVKVQRVSGSVFVDVSTHVADSIGRTSFPLVQEELRTSGRTFLGNYRLTASFRGISSNPLSTLISGSDVDAVITVPGGPDLSPEGLSVEGTLIDGFPVLLMGNVSNVGEFDAGPFVMRLEVNGELVGDRLVDGLVAGDYRVVGFEWMTVEGEANFDLIVDAFDEVAETSEDDNTYNQMNVIGIGPDYTVDIEMGPDVWAYGNEGEFNIIVSNIGETDPEANDFYLNVTWRSSFANGLIAEYLPYQYIEPGNFVRRMINWTPEITGPVTIRVEVFSKYDRTPINSFDTMVLNVLTLPDIRIVLNSFSIDAPVPVTVNTTVDVMLSVENVGELPAGDFMVRLYDSKKEAASQIGDEALVQGLAPEESVDLTFAWNVGLPIDYHDVIVVMDPMDSVMEQNETNNEISFKVMVDTPPDLTFTDSIGASPKVVTEGKNMTFWATVTNIGKTKATDALIRFYIDSDTNVIESRTIHLSPGQLMNVSFGWVAEGLGLHTLFIVADYWDTIKEPVETNNLRSLDFSVISKPDLYMDENDLRVESDGEIDIGEQVGITAAVRNSGETSAYNVFIRFYDGDPVLGGKIISWKDTQPSVSIDMIPAGGLRWVNVTWKPQTGGYHNIYVVLDLANAIDESDESNNKVYWPVYVQTLADLVFTNLSLFQGDFDVVSAGVGKTLIINATLENRGDTDSPAFKVNFFNGDFQNDPDPLPLGSDVNYLSGKLKGNSKMYIEMPWRVGYPKGVRTIIVKAELLEGTEQRTNNNMISTPIEIFDIDDVPELVPLNDTLLISSGYPGMEIDAVTNPVAYQGMNLSLELSISNIGGKAASNASVHFLASNSTDTWVEHETSIMFLENNGTDFITGYWNLNDLGPNTLKIVVDPENGIREFDEGNNIITINLEVKEAPDVTVTLVREGKHYNFETGQFDMTKGKEYEVSFLVQNLGNHSLSGLTVVYTGPADAPTRTLDLAPYQERVVSFNIKPEIDAGQTAVWKCKVNEDDRFFESSTDNNEASSVINVLEPDAPSMIWIVFLFLALVVLIAIVIGGYFVYKKLKTKDMAKCSNCGGLVEIDAPLCPHCGIEFSDDLECECGEIIPVGSTECPACGRPIAAEPVKTEEEEAEGDEKAEKTEEGGEEELEELEEDQEPPEELEDVEEVQEEVIREQPQADEEELAECFECGALIPVSAPICPHCGAVFE
ncbi:MAG: CARDB domain-containing protein [Thermoplasmatota archaeon]